MNRDNHDDRVLYIKIINAFLNNIIHHLSLEIWYFLLTFFHDKNRRSTRYMKPFKKIILLVNSLSDTLNYLNLKVFLESNKNLYQIYEHSFIYIKNYL